MKTHQLKTILLIILGCDIANFIYIKQYFFPKLLNGPVLNVMLQLKGLETNSLYLEEIQNVAIMSLYNTLSILVFFQIFIMYMALKGKKWALKYYKGYTLSAFILTFLELIFSITNIDPWHLVLFITGIFYTLTFKELKRRVVQ